MSFMIMYSDGHTRSYTSPMVSMLYRSSLVPKVEYSTRTRVPKVSWYHSSKSSTREFSPRMSPLSRSMVSSSSQSPRSIYSSQLQIRSVTVFSSSARLPEKLSAGSIMQQSRRTERMRLPFI